MKFLQIHGFYALASCALAICSSARAQAEELDELREIYFEQIKKVSIPVEIKYGQSLVKLQKALISENNLEEALNVKNEIDKLKAKLAGNQEPEPPASRVPALPTSGKPELTEKEEEGQKFNWRGDFQMISQWIESSFPVQIERLCRAGS
jgi:hypothetical protein